MNYMPEVLKMLGVEVGEKFILKNKNFNPHHFSDDFILLDSTGGHCNHHISYVLIGEVKVEKLPWKPKEDDPYFFVMANGSINESSWSGHVVDYSLFNTNNCFRTAEEITPEIKERILREMKEKYENE